jgi:hypothetical protein
MNPTQIFEIGCDAVKHLKHLGILQDHELTPKEILVFYLRVEKKMTCRAISRLPLLGGRMGIISMCNRLATRYPKYDNDLMAGFGSKVQRGKMAEILKKLGVTRRTLIVNKRIEQLKAFGRMRKLGWSKSKIQRFFHLKSHTSISKIEIQWKKMEEIGEHNFRNTYRPSWFRIKGGDMRGNYCMKKKCNYPSIETHDL